jgi:multiple sugar transport system substrate-binding protein
MSRASEVNMQDSVSRNTFLQRAGLSAAAVAAGAALPELLTSQQTHAAAPAASNVLNVYYWGDTPKHDFKRIFTGFNGGPGWSVSYTPEISDYNSSVQKLTTYLSSGFTGIDALYVDEYMIASFAAAGWLEPLETLLPHESITSVAPFGIKLGTFNGHLYRLPGYAGGMVWFYRTDLFKKAGLQVPTTWDEVVKVGKALSTGGRHGLGIVGKSSYLYSDFMWYVQQAGGDAYHLTSAAARATLKFWYDCLNTWKIMPPDTLAQDQTTIAAAFEDGRIAMVGDWSGNWPTFASAVGSKGKFNIALPPRGPKNNRSLADSWGWCIPKFSKNKAMAAKFIEYATSPAVEVETAVVAGTSPARVALLNNAQVQKAVPWANWLYKYNTSNLMQARSINPQSSRLGLAFASGIDPYLQGQTSLDTAVSQTQTSFNRILNGG